MELPDEVRHRLDRVNRLLATQRTMPNKLEAVAEILERTVPDADAVSIALVLEDAAVTGAASSQLAIEADLVQYGWNEGPCLLAVQERRPVRIEIMEHDERFAHFAPGAVELGIRSSYSVPLLWDGDVVGSINLYSRRSDAFDVDLASQLDPIAGYAAEVIAGSPLYAESLGLVEGLSGMLADNDAVHTVVGLLRGTGRAADEEEALQVLERRAAALGCSVADAAWGILAEHQLEDRRDPP